MARYDRSLIRLARSRRSIVLRLFLFDLILPLLMLSSVPAAANEQDRECRELAPGQSRMIAEDPENPPSANVRRYRVSRDKNDSKIFHVDLNIRFKPTKAAIKEIYGDVPINTNWRGHQVEKIYLQRVNACFDKFKVRLQDSNGIQVTFRVISDPTSTLVPLNEVAIASTSEMGIRPGSDSWNTEMDCTLMIHESLHLTGLVDGYEEWVKNLAGAKMYDCRHGEPRESIMASPSWALEDKVEVTLCQCQIEKCKDSPFHEDTDTKPSSCPESFKASHEIIAESHIKDKYQDIFGGKKGVLIKIRPVDLGPIHALETAQIIAITKPKCVRDNLYWTCAQNAYRTSSLEGCLKAPAECKDGRWSK